MFVAPQLSRLTILRYSTVMRVEISTLLQEIAKSDDCAEIESFISSTSYWKLQMIYIKDNMTNEDLSYSNKRVTYDLSERPTFWLTIWPHHSQ